LSIQKGIQVALKKHGYNINGHIFNIVTCDHRGMNRRSDNCIKRILKDPKALIMFAGLHSPPLIQNVKDPNSGHNINKNKLLTLIPWAAAGLITRSQIDNWLFRLSVDDKYAGQFIVKQTLAEGHKKISLLLVNDGWGKYNKKMMSKALQKNGITPIKTIMFERNLKRIQANHYLSEIYNSGSDTVILVANAPQGITIFSALKELKLENKILIRSHWGITGGKLGKNHSDKISNLNLKVIQTSFSFMNKNLTSHQENVFEELKSISPDINTYSNLKAPVGFIHAYDLTCILIQAIKQSNLTGSVIQDRMLIKRSLENLNHQTPGLIKTYKKPFSKLNKVGSDNHDALNTNNFRMFKYRNDGALVPSEER